MYKENHFFFRFVEKIHLNASAFSFVFIHITNKYETCFYVQAFGGERVSGKIGRKECPMYGVIILFYHKWMEGNQQANTHYSHSSETTFYKTVLTVTSNQGQTMNTKARIWQVTRQISSSDLSFSVSPTWKHLDHKVNVVRFSSSVQCIFRDSKHLSPLFTCHYIG